MATGAMLALGTAACGDDGDSSPTSATSAAERAAQIARLSGRQTELALHGGFVVALGTLQLTPAPVGDGENSKQGIARFPITGAT